MRRAVLIACIAVILPCVTPMKSLAAGGDLLPTFGTGTIKVRLYADYFCPPCREMEPAVEPVIAELVRDGVITITFIDTPFYRYSSLYARHFLYALNEKKELERAFTVRRSLIEAAKTGIATPDRLESFLKERKIIVKPFDPRSIFDVLSRYLRDDKIDSTPSCVIEINGKTDKYKGGDNIIEALTRLKAKGSGK